MFSIFHCMMKLCWQCTHGVYERVCTVYRNTNGYTERFRIMHSTQCYRWNGKGKLETSGGLWKALSSKYISIKKKNQSKCSRFKVQAYTEVMNENSLSDDGLKSVLLLVWYTVLQHHFKILFDKCLHSVFYCKLRFLDNGYQFKQIWVSLWHMHRARYHCQMIMCKFVVHEQII